MSLNSPAASAESRACSALPGNGQPTPQQRPPQTSRPPSSVTKQDHPVVTIVNRLNLPAGPSDEIRIHSSPNAAQRMPPMRIVINLRVTGEPTLAGSASV